MLATAATERPFEWEEHLRQLYKTQACRQQLGTHRFFLMFGRQARLLINIAYGSPTPALTSLSEYASKLRVSLEKAYQKVCTHTGHKFERQKALYDRRVHGKPLAEGDLVWLHSPVPKHGIHKNIA